MNEQILSIIRTHVTDAALQSTLIASLTQAKFTVRTEAEETQFKTNLLSTINKDEIIKEEKKVWMRRVEDDIRELTGLKQNPSEPYHEFMKRGIKKVQDELETATKALEKGAAEGGGVWKTKYETLEQQSRSALAEKEKSFTDLKNKVVTQERRLELEKVFNPLQSKFVDQLPSFFNEYKDQVLNDTLRKSAVIDGKLVLVDEAGNPVKDSNLNNIEVNSFLADKFKDVIKTEKQQAGAGTAPPRPGTPPAAGAGAFSVAAIPSEVTTQNQLTDYLGKTGLLQGTPEFDKAFGEAVTQKNITKLF